MVVELHYELQIGCKMLKHTASSIETELTMSSVISAWVLKSFPSWPDRISTAAVLANSRTRNWCVATGEKGVEWLMSRATPPQAVSPVLQPFRRMEYPRMLDVHDGFKSVLQSYAHR
ncbi:hypothetical protein TNCV_2163891 [Trichonephila clavipes]|nr:hypothetical protein TNCV_2163891 [Trichonephila clavipes]